MFYVQPAAVVLTIKPKQTVTTGDGADQPEIFSDNVDQPRSGGLLHSDDVSQQLLAISSSTVNHLGGLLHIDDVSQPLPVLSSYSVD